MCATLRIDAQDGTSTAPTYEPCAASSVAAQWHRLHLHAPCSLAAHIAQGDAATLPVTSSLGLQRGATVAILTVPVPAACASGCRQADGLRLHVSASCSNDAGNAVVVPVVAGSEHIVDAGSELVVGAGDVVVWPPTDVLVSTRLHVEAGGVLRLQAGAVVQFEGAEAGIVCSGEGSRVEVLGESDKVVTLAPHSLTPPRPWAGISVTHGCTLHIRHAMLSGSGAQPMINAQHGATVTLGRGVRGFGCAPITLLTLLSWYRGSDSGTRHGPCFGCPQQHCAHARQHHSVLCNWH